MFYFIQVLEGDFEDMLMDVLYPLVDRLGDDTAMVSQSAYVALMDVTHACGCR